MPQKRPHPAEFVAKKSSFPYGPYQEEVPPEVYLAAGLAIRLRTKIGDESVRYIAKKAGLSPQTILNILNGTTWPDLRTIAKLETAFNYLLWGYEHRNPPEYFYDSHNPSSPPVPTKPNCHLTVPTRA